MRELGRHSVGDAVIIQRPRSKSVVYGRVWKLEGSNFGELTSILRIVTPGGSVIVSGCAWVKSVNTDEEKAKFLEWEREGNSGDGTLYDDKPELLAFVGDQETTR